MLNVETFTIRELQEKSFRLKKTDFCDVYRFQTNNDRVINWELHKLMRGITIDKKLIRMISDIKETELNVRVNSRKLKIQRNLKL